MPFAVLPFPVDRFNPGVDNARLTEESGVNAGRWPIELKVDIAGSELLENVTDAGTYNKQTIDILLVNLEPRQLDVRQRYAPDPSKQVYAVRTIYTHEYDVAGMRSEAAAQQKA